MMPPSPLRILRMSIEQVAVTGGSGLIGSEIIDVLDERDYTATNLDRETRTSMEWFEIAVYRFATTEPAVGFSVSPVSLSVDPSNDRPP